MGQLRYLEARSSGSVRARGVVVLLHAFPLTARMWQPQLGALSERGWHVIAPEMASETMDDCAGDVIDLLDGLRDRTAESKHRRGQGQNEAADDRRGALSLRRFDHCRQRGQRRSRRKRNRLRGRAKRGEARRRHTAPDDAHGVDE